MSQYILSCRSEEGWQKTIEEEREMNGGVSEN